MPTWKKRRGNNNDTQPIQNDNHQSTSSNNSPQAEATNNPAVAEPQAQVEVDPIAQAQSWWDTGDAIRYFGVIDGEVSAREAVEKRIEILQKGYANATGWKLTIHDFDQQELCTDHEVFSFQLKCRYLSLALRYALEDIPNKLSLIHI